MVTLSEGHRAVTPVGREVAEKLVAERRASLARLCAGSAPEQHAELAGLLTRLARELVREPSEHDVGAPV
jgi:DNA-binding MarR family transcriptional regulator